MHNYKSIAIYLYLNILVDVIIHIQDVTLYLFSDRRSNLTFIFIIVTSFIATSIDCR
uniref:Uncharacterized protein n=1 Tax=Octopus bimaculoides TaxID=37653 RepID=A0A0L8HT26_OCTBM